MIIGNITKIMTLRFLCRPKVAVTERYLSRLPKRNKGGVLMSDILGLERSDEPDWVGYDPYLNSELDSQSLAPVARTSVVIP